MCVLLSVYFPNLFAMETSIEETCQNALGSFMAHFIAHVSDAAGNLNDVARKFFENVLKADIGGLDALLSLLAQAGWEDVLKKQPAMDVRQVFATVIKSRVCLC